MLFLLLQKKGWRTLFLIGRSSKTLSNFALLTPSKLCFQTRDVVTFFFPSAFVQRLHCILEQSPTFYKNTDTHGLTWRAWGFFFFFPSCNWKWGLRSVDGIPSSCLSVPSPGWSRSHLGCHVKYIMTAERRRLIDNRTCFFYLVFMKRLVKVIPEAESTSRRGEKHNRKDGRTCDR